MLKEIKTLEQDIGVEATNNVVTQILIQQLDLEWTKYLELSNKLREGVSLRSLEQVSPLHLYVEESDKAFEELKKEVAYKVIFALLSLKIKQSEEDNSQYAETRENLEEDLKLFKKFKDEIKQITQSNISSEEALLSSKEKLAKIMLEKQKKHHEGR